MDYICIRKMAMVTIGKSEIYNYRRETDMKKAWNIVHDCDGENGEPTCWAKEINHKKYGRFVWITKNENETYDVEVDIGKFFNLITCKTLISAKRSVALNL